MTWTLDLPDMPYATPNTREHWSERSSLNAAWRQAAGWLAKKERIPECGQIHVRLHFYPDDRRKRDADNLVPGVLKPCLDGLVDAGVVPDDSPEFVDWSRPRIHAPDGEGRRWELVVTDVSEGSVA